MEVTPVMQQPTVSPAAARRAPWVVGTTLLATVALIATVVLAMGRPDYWMPFAGAVGVALLCAVVSVVIILRSANKPADYVITMTMGLAAVRILISIAGLMIMVVGFKLAPEPTAMMICSFYVAMLIAESMLVSKSLKTT